jgi:hypothetical protein
MNTGLWGPDDELDPETEADLLNDQYEWESLMTTEPEEEPCE